MKTCQGCGAAHNGSGYKLCRRCNTKRRLEERDLLRAALYGPGICLVCGDPCMTLTSTVCSPSCSWVWNAWRVRKTTMPARYRECKWCGEAFEFYTCGKENEGQYCSRACAATAAFWDSPLHRRVTMAVRESRAVRRARGTPCRVCGRLSVRAECGPACRREWNRREAGRYDRAQHEAEPFVCRECGEMHVPEYGDKKRVFCSDACLRRHYKADHGKNHRKRARHYGVEYEPVNREKVYARDGWRCGICGEAIDRRTKFPHPDSASLDHIVPMSQGGGHTYRNVQAAHFMCNSTKGAESVGSQLLLIG